MKWADHMQMSHQKVGELNGLWAFAFKLANLCMPFIVAWCVWATTQIYSLRERQTKTEAWMAQGPRFTQESAEKLRLQILDQVASNEAKNQAELMDELKGLRKEMTEFKVLLAAHMASAGKDKQ